MQDHVLNWSYLAGLVFTGLTMALGMLFGFINVRRAKTDRERSFVRRACFVTWMLTLGFLLSVLWLPSPQRWIVSPVLFFLIPMTIHQSARRHALLREKDAREQQRTARSAP